MNTNKKTSKTNDQTKTANAKTTEVKTPKTNLVKKPVERNTTKKTGIKTTPKKQVTPTEKKSKTSSPTDLKGFLLEGLNEIYSIEKYLESEFPKLIAKASGENLKENLQDHLEDIKENISTLDKIYEIMETNASTKKVNIDGLVTLEDKVFQTLPESIKDAALLLSCQKIRHHKVAFYTTLASLSKTLDENKIAKKLREIIKTEKKSQKQISKTAIENIEDNQYELEKQQKQKEKEAKKAEKEAKKLEKQKQKEAQKNVKIETEYDD